VLASLDPQDTIAAVASPAGNGLRGLIRLSGPEAWSIALAGFTPDRDAPLPRRAEIRSGSVRVDGLRPELPAMIALWPGPRTYTGQNIAEIHTHGSPPLVNKVLAGCLGRGARHAEPGEFTLRAFLCGRIDLTRAEAVAGVIDARNQAQLDAALRQLGGGLSGPILALRDRLLDLVAHLEANLDFAEEADVNPLGRALLAEELAASADELTELATRLNQRDRSGGLPRVVLIGPPNAGKSRLFNALLGGDQAIVSPRAGTTRDYLSGFCQCDELVIELIDTAGIENPQTAIESQAQSMRAGQARQADLVVFCFSEDTIGVLTTEVLAASHRIQVWTKCDIKRPQPHELPQAIRTSAATGEGLAELKASIARVLRSQDSEGDLATSTGARCRDSFVRAGEALQAAAETLLTGGGEELVAFDLRLAIDELGKVVGAVVTDDILDRIFSRFCIGK
jgi:tRNA modification GTPase